MTDPNPEDYGLREFTMEGKTILALKEYSDELVIIYIRRSLSEALTDLGKRLDVSSEILAQYQQTEKAFLENPKQGGEALLSDSVLIDRILTDLKAAGCKLISTVSQEELRERYIEGLRTKANGNDAVRRFEDYYAALRKSTIHYFAALRA